MRNRRQEKIQQHESEAVKGARGALDALKDHNYNDAAIRLKRALDNVNLAKAEAARR